MSYPSELALRFLVLAGREVVERMDPGAPAPLEVGVGESVVMLATAS